MRITWLLIITLLFASAMDTLAITTDDSPPPQEDAVPPITDDSPPPAEESDTSSLDPALFAPYKEADGDLVGVDKYDFTWIAEKTGKCYPKGYYDDTVLKTESDIKSCFDRLRAGLELLNYGGGEWLYADTQYYSSKEDHYCVVECSTTSNASVLSSIQRSLVSAAFGLLAFVALHYF